MLHVLVSAIFKPMHSGEDLNRPSRSDRLKHVSIKSPAIVRVRSDRPDRPASDSSDRGRPDRMDRLSRPESVSA